MGKFMKISGINPELYFLKKRFLIIVPYFLDIGSY